MIILRRKGDFKGHFHQSSNTERKWAFTALNGRLYGVANQTMVPRDINHAFSVNAIFNPHKENLLWIIQSVPLE
jgi:hypothetical protein